MAARRTNYKKYGPRQRGLMLVLSGPSGGGKTTIAARLCKDEPFIVHSISATSRAPRGQEKDGVDYFFLDKSTFEQRIKEGYFLEHAKFLDNCYGTPRGPVEKHLAEGRDVVFDIEWQGARQLAEAAPEDVVRVFLLPPSMKILAERLTGRKTEAPEAVKRRLEQAREDMSHWEEYDYVFVNENLEQTLRRIRVILRAERLKRQRQPWQKNFVAALFDEIK